jgi:hypothetical protein
MHNDERPMTNDRKASVVLHIIELLMLDKMACWWHNWLRCAIGYNTLKFQIKEWQR